MSKINQEEYEVLKELDDKWKWIARDKDGVLGVYDAKVVKTKFHNFWIMGIKNKIDLTLFSFIQWEDESPYNIAELIEEYEDSKEYKDSLVIEYFMDKAKESEETEVKSKQELIEEWESAIEAAEFYGKGKEERLISYMKDFVSDLNQLDEPEITLNEAFNKLVETHILSKEEIVKHFEQLEIHNGKVTYGELDEPEVLSSDWIDKHTEHHEYIGYAGVPVDDLQNLLVPEQEITFEQAHDKLREESILSERSFDYYWNCINDNVEIDEPGNLLVPQQDERTQLEIAYKDILSRKEFLFNDKKYIVVEKPVIPQFVADFISDREDWTLYELFDDEWLYREYDQIAKWLYDNDEHTNRERELDLAIAFRQGYTVEKEQKYYVIDEHKVYLLAKDEERNKVETVAKLVEIYGHNHVELNYQLTEQEIKDYDERYIPFMVPVDEVNND